MGEERGANTHRSNSSTATGEAVTVVELGIWRRARSSTAATAAAATRFAAFF